MSEKKLRRIAVEMLSEVMGADGAKSRDALDLAALGSNLDARDRAFVMEAAYGTIRHLYTLQWILGMFAKKPSGLPLKTRTNLYLGIYQLFYMRVPDWAAVNESVNLESRYRSLVNAVLRSAARERAAIESKIEADRQALKDMSDPHEAARMIGRIESYPEWLISRWIARYGVRDAYELAIAGNAIPNITIRANTLRVGRDELLDAMMRSGVSCEPTSVSPVGIRLGPGVTLAGLDEFRGMFMVQDEAAQLVGLLAAPKSGMRVMDACAAPGGKAAHMAELMHDNGEVVALDISPRRVETMKANLDAMGYGCVRPRVGDIHEYSDDSGFDMALADAPCSSMGVIRRNPDVKYRHSENDIARFAERQLDILSACAKLVRPGGRLVYCVCSIEPEEGAGVTEKFLSGNQEYEKVKPVGGIFDGNLIYTSSELRTLTHRDRMDGFYAAAFMRRS